MINFCTLFDSNYLDKVIALCNSLKRHSRNFRLFCYCFDSFAYKAMQQLDYPNVELIEWSTVEDENLLRLKSQRSKAEYCWTCTPVVIEYTLDNYNTNNCTYIDADMYFYADPQILFDEIAKANAHTVITAHRFPDNARGRHYLKKSGKYCVEFNYFDNSPEAREALTWWKEQCFEWCFATYEDGKHGDQKYLEEFPRRFNGVHELEYEGGCVAPWNLSRYKLASDKKASDDAIFMQQKDESNAQVFQLVLYHFHNIRYINEETVNICSGTKDKALKDTIYVPYLQEITKARKTLKECGINLGISKIYASNPIHAFYQKHIMALRIRRLSDVYKLNDNCRLKVTYVTNVPSPYTVDFFNELQKYCDLFVIFEAEIEPGRAQQWYTTNQFGFRYVFLKSGIMEEKHINLKMWKYINRQQDVLILSSYGYATERFAYIAAKIKRIPYVMAIDGAYIHEENFLKYLYKKFLIKGAKRYLSPGKITDDYYVHYGVNNKRIYQYPFTSLRKADVLSESVTKAEKNALRSELGIKEEKVIVSVGRFDFPNGHRKGFDILIRAFSKCPKEYGLYIIGGEPTSEYTELAQNLHLTNVRFIGFKQKDELNKYYKAADLFCLATREDIWGLVINEAMACGLPIVTTDKCVAGLELVTDNINGYIVRSEDDAAIADCIIKICDDPELQDSMSRNSLKTIRDYTIENMAECFYNAISL